MWALDELPGANFLWSWMEVTRTSRNPFYLLIIISTGLKWNICILPFPGWIPGTKTTVVRNSCQLQGPCFKKPISSWSWTTPSGHYLGMRWFQEMKSVWSPHAHNGVSYKNILNILPFPIFLATFSIFFWVVILNCSMLVKNISKIIVWVSISQEKVQRCWIKQYHLFFLHDKREKIFCWCKLSF